MPFATRMIPTGGAFDPERVEAAAYFDGSSDRLDTPTPSGASSNTFTLSVWCQRLNFNQSVGIIWGSGSSSRDLLFWSNDSIFFLGGGGGDTNIDYRDHGWYHIHVKCDAGAVELYVNGVLNDSTTGYSFNHTNTAKYIGTTTQKQNLAQLAFVDGTALDVTDFGEFITVGTNGQRWAAKSKADVKALVDAGSANSYLYCFDGATIGEDASTHGNDATATSMDITNALGSHTPTKTYATLNPLKSRYATGIKEGGFGHHASGSNYEVTMVTIPMQSGKFYAEMETGGDWLFQFGIGRLGGDATYALTNSFTIMNNGAGTRETRTNNASGTNSRTADSNGDILQVAYDADTKELWLGRNDTWYGTGSPNPSTGTDPTYTGVAGAEYGLLLSGGNGSGQVQLLNTGQKAWAYTPPTDFDGLYYERLTAPSEHGADWFNALAYEGDGTAIGSGGQAVTGAGFQPDLAWIKNRDQSDKSVIHDVLRGATNHLHPDTNDAEATDAEGMQSFDADGFTVGNDHTVNASAESYIAWLFKAAGAGVANTDGDENSTVSVASAGHFSIIEDTGTGTAHTIGHGLPGAPECIIRKEASASSTSDAWPVYHAFNGTTDPETDYFIFSSVNLGRDARLDYSLAWNDTAPTATVFSVGTWNAVNATGSDFITYAFRSVPGVCKVGSYEGNGAADGPFIDLGFTPRWIMVKRADSSGDWIIYDTTRTPENEVDDQLLVNTTAAETTGSEEIDFLSTGFKVRTADAYINANNGDYIYIAMADIGYGQELPPPLGR